MQVARLRAFAATGLLGTLMALGSVSLGAAQEPDTTPAATTPSYRFVLTPVLTYSRHTYGLVFRLNRDLPRSKSHRAKAALVINDQQALAIRGGGRQQRCFMASLEGIAGGPRFGKLYAVELRIPGSDTVHKRVRLKRATPGYGAFFGNETRDPKARDLHCGPR